MLWRSVIPTILLRRRLEGAVSHDPTQSRYRNIRERNHMAAGEGEVAGSHNHPAVVGVHSPEVCTKLEAGEREERRAIVRTDIGWGAVLVVVHSHLDTQALLDIPTCSAGSPVQIDEASRTVIKRRGLCPLDWRSLDRISDNRGGRETSYCRTRVPVGKDDAARCANSGGWGWRGWNSEAARSNSLSSWRCRWQPWVLG